MPLVTPKKGENENKFVNRCMGDDNMVREFNQPDQRKAVCHNQYNRQKKK